MKIRPLVIGAALAATVLAQEPPKPTDPPRRPEPGADGPREPRPPLPPGEERERPARGPEGRGDAQRPDRPPFPPRDGEGPPRGPEGRRFGSERRPEMPDAPGGPRTPERVLKPTAYLGVISSAAPAALAVQLGLPEGFGLVVDEVLPESPAKAAGLERYDVLKQLNEQQLVDPAQLATLVRGLGKDKEVTLTIVRKGQEQKLTVKIGEKMLPERRTGEQRPDAPDMEQLRRRAEGSMRGGGDQATREMQERMRAFHERLRDYQRAMEEWQTKVRQWQEKREGEMPMPPPVPMMEPPPHPRPTGANKPGGPINPVDILRDMRPGAPGQVRTDWSDGASRWDASRARMVTRDRDGEVELGIKDGKRTLTVRNPVGEVVFAGPVDTPDERAAIPEPLRGKLAALEAPPPPPPGGPDAFRNGPQPPGPGQFQPQRPREPEVQ